MSESDSHTLINQMMSYGYDAAAKSLSRLTNSPVVAKSSLFTNLTHKTFIGPPNGKVFVVTTNMIGELAGKSYLLISEADFKMVCQFLRLKGMDDLMDAFLLEMDNILSAAVIATISDCLKIEVYGDVPHLNKISDEQYSNSLSEILNNEDGRFVVYTGSLALEGNCPISFQFIWKMSRKIYDFKIKHQLSA